MKLGYFRDYKENIIKIMIIITVLINLDARIPWNFKCTSQELKYYNQLKLWSEGNMNERLPQRLHHN